jgi:hypothetical protein
MMKESIYAKLSRRLPKHLLYHCAIQVVCETTTGKYGNTLLPEVPAMECIARFARIHAIPGCGEDEFYDSNRAAVVDT